MKLTILQDVKNERFPSTNLLNKTISRIEFERNYGKISSFVLYILPDCFNL